MDFVIVFFRDVLDGPVYIAVSIVCSILICSCIGYMGEKYLDEKKQGEDFASKHAFVGDDKPLTAEEAQKSLQNNVTQSAENNEAAQQAAADVAASDAPAEQSPEGEVDLEDDEPVEENASVVYAIGGGQVEELLDDD